jgi:hypothetical protein
MHRSHLVAIFTISSLAALSLFEKYSTMLESLATNIFPKFPYFTYFDLTLAIIVIIGVVMWLKSSKHPERTIEDRKKHREQLFTDFEAKYDERIWTGKWCEIFSDFLQGDHFVQHLHTGYPEVFSSLQSYAEVLKLEKKATDEERWYKSNAFKELMEKNLIIKVHGKTSELEGVCKECLKFYEKDPKYNDLKAKLESFKNPCVDTH